MGVDLSDIVVKHPREMSDFAGERVAIDAFNTLYQFLATIRGPDGTPLKDAEGRVTSHLSGLLYRNTSFLEAGIKPIYVFDGDPTASWAIVDVHEGEVTAEIRRETFDTLAVSNALTARGLPGDVYRAATVRTGKVVR